MEQSELRECVRRHLAGDARATEALYRHCWPLARRAAWALVADASTAEDVAQDAFVRVLKGLPGWRGDGPLDAWVTRIVVNQARTTLRREGHHAEFDGDIPDPAAEGAPERAAARHEVRRAVRALAPERREVIALRFWLGLTSAQVAGVLGLPKGTVDSRLSRAMAELRTTMEVNHGRP